MNPFAQLFALLTSSIPIYCIENEVANALSSVAHLTPDNFLLVKVPTYKEKIQEEIQPLIASSQEKGIFITTDYDSNDIPNGSIAYHSVQGLIMAESRWWFSSTQFEKDLLAADRNPNINVHFLHINSGGGEAWYLDQLAKTMSSLTKPIYTFARKTMASAGYYIGVHGQVIKMCTQNDTVGSIGTIIDGWDFIGYFEKMGLTRLRETATNSDLKNKMYEDFRKGNSKQVQSDILDPYQQQFAAAVRSARPLLNNYDDNHPIFRAESFLASKCVGNLIDGICSIEEALSEANQLGNTWKSTQETNQRLSKLL